MVPSLDQAREVELASASAWRIGSTIGIQVDGYYQKGDGTNDAKAENIGNSVLFAYQPGNFITELFYYSDTKRIDVNTTNSTVTSEDENDTGISLKFAIRGNRSVSLGLGYNRSETDDVSNDKKNTTTSFEGSFSLRLFDGLMYAGGGMRRVTAEQGSDDSLKYNEVIAGIAVQIGDPLETMFQTEASVRQIPETESDKGLITKQPKSTVSHLSLELQTGSFFFAYRIGQLVIENDAANDDYKSTDSKIGVGLKLGGLSLGLYRDNHQIDSGDDSVDYDTYALTVGYNFI